MVCIQDLLQVEREYELNAILDDMVKSLSQQLAAAVEQTTSNGEDDNIWETNGILAELCANAARDGKHIQYPLILPLL
jgi:hypothetical protein